MVTGESIKAAEPVFLNVYEAQESIPRNELRGLVPNSNIHESVSDLYINGIDLPICQQQNSVGRPILGIYKSLTDT